VQPSRAVAQSAPSSLSRAGDHIRGGENSEMGLHYFWKISNFGLEISNFFLVFLTIVST
jgi:hypothetical protein